ncbi:GNAT family N-acetyltransferase [Paenibacillus flagellatus]|nr:GNAT family N-acetyltransferase [Paenibacillus flagellatus]
MTDATIETASATSEDEAFLFELYGSTRTEEAEAWGWGDREREAFLLQQFQCQQRAYRLQYPHAECRIIRCDGSKAGRILTEEGPDEIRVIDISLLPPYRGLRIGTALLRRWQAVAAVCGKPLTLHVLRANRALRLYDRLGFRTVSGDEAYVAMEWRRGTPIPG